MPRIAFLFPGQGAQYVGMGGQLCDGLPKAKKLFEEAAVILGYDLLDVCVNGPSEKLDSTVVSQPAIFVASLAALESLRAGDDNPEGDCKAAAGLSLGEYTALVYAGVMSFSDGLRLVHRRGEAMQAASDAAPGGMVSVLGLATEKVEELCRAAGNNGLLKIANLLCPNNIVISGAEAACAEAVRLAPEMGARGTFRLKVAGAFHTELMKPADARLAEALAAIRLNQPRIPVWSNVDARSHNDPQEIRDLLVQQVLNPVLWEQTMRNLVAEGVEQFIEIGPGRVLTGLLKRVNRKISCRNVPA